MHTYTHTYTNKYIHTCIPTYLPTYIPTYLHTYIHTYIRTCTCIHKFTCRTFAKFKPTVFFLDKRSSLSTTCLQRYTTLTPFVLSSHQCFVFIVGCAPFDISHISVSPLSFSLSLSLPLLLTRFLHFFTVSGLFLFSSFACFFFYLLTYLPTYHLSTYLSTYLPTYLPT